MKKIFSLLLLAALTFSMAACGNNEQENETGQAQSSQVQAEQSEESEPQTESGETQNESEEADMQEDGIRVASDDAQMQTEDPSMPTRVLEEGTRINMHFGDTVIPGILNDSETAQALIEMLPYTVHMSHYSHDFCGVMPDELPYKEEEVHYGWLNGDIDYAINAPYFTILFADEENSEVHGDQVNIGVIDCELSRISELSGSYDVLIELAE